MKKRWMKRLIISTVLLSGSAQAEKEPAHADPDYNKRFLKHQLAPILEAGKELFVSPTGRSGASGSQKDPFGSLEDARDTIRTLRKNGGIPAGGVTVWLLEGDYHLSESFKLEKQDSGTDKAPIVYRGISMDKVSISGGVHIDSSKMAVVEGDALERLHPDARGKVMSLTVSDTVSQCFAGDGKYGLLSMNGYLLTLAQWPNRGYYHIKNILDAGPTTRWLKPGEKPAAYSKENPTGGKFTLREELSPLVQAEFACTGDMQAQGYFHNDWYFQKEQVGGIQNGEVQLLRYTRYGIKAKIKSIPRRVRLVNVLAELDEPGEWYFDRKNQTLYAWPIDGFVPGQSKMTAVGGAVADKNRGLVDYSGQQRQNAGKSLIEMKDTQFITIRDITFENSGDVALKISEGKYNLLAGSTIRNGLNKGVIINGGFRNGITGCHFHDLQSAFTLSGGDFKTLTRCYNFATNNDIHSCRRRGYGMISLRGVGIYFAHNVIHDMNGAVSFVTVDSLQEYNEYYNIGYEMGDFNVSYCGALWHMMNNVIRYNFVHHLLEPGGHPVCGFRNDDGGAGLQIYGNVFYRPGRGAAQFAGPLNSLENNIAIDCNILWWTNKKDISEEGIKKAWKDLEKFGSELPHGDKGDNIYIMEQLIGKKGWTKKPWITEFPQLAKAIELNPFAQTFCRVDNNYMCNVRRPFHIHGGDGTIEGMENKKKGQFKDLPKDGIFMYPVDISMNDFVDPETLNFNFADGFEPMKGFRPIPFDDIGMKADAFRPNPPSKEAYRKAVFEKFKHDRAGRYNAEQVNARYPEPAYLK